MLLKHWVQVSHTWSETARRGAAGGGRVDLGVREEVFDHEPALGPELRDLLGRKQRHDRRFKAFNARAFFAWPRAGGRGGARGRDVDGMRRKKIKGGRGARPVRARTPGYEGLTLIKILSR